MPEITIIESDKNKKNIENLTEEERQFALMQMGETNETIPEKYWESFSQMITSELKHKEIISEIPTMRELIFRNIITTAKNFVGDKMPYFMYGGNWDSLIATKYIVTPVIHDFTYKVDFGVKRKAQRTTSSTSNVSQPKETAYSKKYGKMVTGMPSTLGIKKQAKGGEHNGGERLDDYYNGGEFYNNIPATPQVTGSAFRRSKGSRHSSVFGQPKMRKDILAKDIRMSIRVRFEFPVYCITETGAFYIAPAHEEIDIIGFSLGNMCGSIGNDFMSFLIELIKLGIINYKQLAANCIEDVIVQVLGDVKKVVYEEPVHLENMYLFGDIATKIDEEMYAILNDLISKYDFSYSPDAFKITSEIATSVTLANLRFNIDLGENPELILEKNANDQAMVFNALNTPYLTYIDLVKKITGYSPNGTYYSSFIYTLRGIDAFGLIWKAIISGKDSKAVKEEIDRLNNAKLSKEFSKSIEQNLAAVTYKANVIFGIVKQLFGEPRAKSLRMEAGKSGTNGDLVLNLLTAKEKEYVTNELERRESYLLAIAGNKCPHLLAMKKFRLAKTDEEISRMYLEIKKFLPKTVTGGASKQIAHKQLVPKQIASKQLVSKHAPNQLAPLHASKHVSKHQASSHSMIKCAVCNFDLVCPHVLELMELKVHKLPPNQIKASMNQFIDDKPLHENYYCKICGEFLVTSDVYDNSMTESDTRLYSTIADELKTMLWGEIASVVRFLDINVFINVNKLITSIITGIYDFIFEIEKQLMRSKTNTSDDVNNKKRLFIVIYAYAYIINLIMKSDGAIKFKVFPNVVSPKPSDLVQFMKYAVINIINTKNIIINQITNITTDQIVEKIREAYKNIAVKDIKGIDMETTEDELPLYQLLFNDSVYDYYYYANMLESGRARKNMGDMYDKVDYIMGDIGAKKIVDKKSAKKNAKKNAKKVENENLPLFEVARIPNWSDDDSANFMNGKYTEITPKIIRGYKKKAFQIFSQVVKTRGFGKFIFANDISGEIGKLSKEFIANSQTLDAFKKQEEKFYNLLNLPRIIGISSWELYSGFYSRKIKTRDFEKGDVKLGSLYDESGNPHNFNKFIFSELIGENTTEKNTAEENTVVKNTKSTELTVADLENKAKENSSLFGLGKIIDRRCSICDILESKAEKLDENKIIDSLIKKSTRDNFFKFYLNRCPAGTGNKSSIHVWQNNKCVQCELTQEMQHNASLGKISEEAMKYYEKYEAQYFSEIEKSIETYETNTKEKPEASDAHIEVESDTNFSKWTFNYNRVSDVATMLNFNPNAFMCIGSHERVEYEDIKSGKYLPPIVENYDDTRFNIIFSYIQLLITEYNNIRYYHTILKPPEHISEIIDNSGIKKHELAELEHLKEVGINFFQEYKSARKSLSPNTLIEFLLESLATFIKSIVAGYEKLTSDQSIKHAAQQICKLFATQFVKKMLKSEEFKTAYSQVNWNSFKVKETSIDVILENTEMVEKIELVDNVESLEDDKEEKEDKEDKEEDEDDYGDTNEVMKNKFDIDLDPGQDYEDFDNEIGEESELL